MSTEKKSNLLGRVVKNAARVMAEEFDDFFVVGVTKDGWISHVGNVTGDLVDKAATELKGNISG